MKNAYSHNSLKKSAFKSTFQSSNDYFVNNIKHKRKISDTHVNKLMSPDKLYQTINLDGTSKRRVGSKYNQESKEEIKYSRKKRVEIPCLKYNSMRTLIPNLDSDIIKPFTPKANFNKESKEFSYISKVDITQPKRKLNPKCYKSQCFMYKKNPQKPNCLSSRKSQFIKYSTTTQIVNLPGGTKRLGTDIKDDCSRRNYSFSNLRRKYNINSNIACLPGCTINPVSRSVRKFSGRKNQSSFDYQNKVNNDILSHCNNRYKAAGKIFKDAPKRGKKLIDLTQWKNDYYSKLTKLYNNVNYGNCCYNNFRVYKNQSHFNFIN